MDGTTLLIIVLGIFLLVLLVLRNSGNRHSSPKGGHGFVAYRKDGRIEICDLGEAYDDCRYHAADWLSERRYSRIEYTDPTGKQTTFTEKNL